MSANPIFNSLIQRLQAARGVQPAAAAPAPAPAAAASPVAARPIAPMNNVFAMRAGMPVAPGTAMPGAPMPGTPAPVGMPARGTMATAPGMVRPAMPGAQMPVPVQNAMAARMSAY